VLTLRRAWRELSLEARQFEDVTRTSPFSPGKGMPGQRLGDRCAWTLRMFTRDPNFPRAEIAASEGLHGAFAFPIRWKGGPASWNFFSVRLAADPNMLDMMATIGTQPDRGVYETPPPAVR